VTNETKHDHIITYKADFDILSTANSLQVSELQAVNVTQAWFPELGEFEQMEMNVYNMKQEKKIQLCAKQPSHVRCAQPQRHKQVGRAARLPHRAWSV
jgi:primary-amine oxidase